MATTYGQFDRRSAERIGAATRYIEGMYRNDATMPGQRHVEPKNFIFGKLDQAVAFGALSSPNNVVSEWLGPAWGVDDADTGEDYAADYSWGDFDSGTYVALTRHKGKWYVSCLPESGS